MRTLWWLLVVAGCGDNNACEPHVAAFPAGLLSDPMKVALPGCVPGGLYDMHGRWFVSKPDDRFAFQYPAFEGNCESGFRRVGVEDDLDASDGYTVQTWSDGTRVVVRSYSRYPETGPIQFEYAWMWAACLTADGTVVVGQTSADTTSTEVPTFETGSRFARKDELARGLELVGSVSTQGPDATVIDGYNVDVDGDHAYVVGPRGVDIIDVSDPASPRVDAHVDGEFNDLKLAHSADRVIAYVAPLYQQATTLVIDVTDPTRPRSANVLHEYSHSLFVTAAPSPRLYLGSYVDGVPVYDITDPATPVRLGAFALPIHGAGVHDMFPDRNMVYVNDTTAGMFAMDITAGLDAPVERGHIATTYSHTSFSGVAGGRKIILHGDEGMTPDGGAFLRVLDGDPDSPTFMTELSRYFTRPEVGIHNFQLVGDRLYIAYYQDGVRVVDLSTPTKPVEVAHYNTWDDTAAIGAAFEGALGIRVVDGLIYVADSLRGLLILRET
jgi:hypothetical protein